MPDLPDHTNCTHSIRLSSLCCICGIDLDSISSKSKLNYDSNSNLNFSENQINFNNNKMYSINTYTDQLTTTESVALNEGLINKKRFDDENKMCLVVDLDQTVLHCCVDPRVDDFILRGEVEEVYVDDKGIMNIGEKENKKTSKDSKCDLNEKISNNTDTENENTNLNDNDKNLNIYTDENKKKSSGLDKDTEKKEVLEHSTSHEKMKNDEKLDQINKKRKIIDKKEENCILTNETKTKESNLNESEVETNKISKIYTFYLNNQKYYVSLRPHLASFLTFAQKKFVLSVYTMGNKEYGKKILQIIDPQNKIFNKRIISRDENNSLLTKSLNRLSLVHSNLIVIDDRMDVWNFCGNVIGVRPYFYFREGDINCPFVVGRKREKEKSIFLKNDFNEKSIDGDVSKENENINESKTLLNLEKAVYLNSNENIINEKEKSGESLNQNIDLINNINMSLNLNLDQKTSEDSNNNKNTGKNSNLNDDIKFDENEIYDLPEDLELLKNLEEESKNDEKIIDIYSEESEIMENKDIIRFKNNDNELIFVQKLLEELHCKYFKFIKKDYIDEKEINQANGNVANFTEKNRNLENISEINKNGVENSENKRFKNTGDIRNILKNKRKKILKEKMFYIEKMKNQQKVHIDTRYIKKVIKLLGGEIFSKKKIKEKRKKEIEKHRSDVEKDKNTTQKPLVDVDLARNIEDDENNESLNQLNMKYYVRIRPDFIVSMSHNKVTDKIIEKQVKYECDIVSFNWILECLYSFGEVDIEPFILKKYEEDLAWLDDL